MIKVCSAIYVFELHNIFETHMYKYHSMQVNIRDNYLR